MSTWPGHLVIARMTGLHVGLLIAAIVCFDMLIVRLILGAMVSGTLGVLARKCPAIPMSPSADYREFQDMKFGAVNFGKGVHIGADESGLHLVPVLFLRWVGARPSSVPWTMVELLPDAKVRRIVHCRLAGLKAQLPAWCFDRPI